MNKNSIICPTRSRFVRFMEMYESFVQMSSQSDIVFCVDNDDPQLKKYEKYFMKWMIDFVVGPRETTTVLFNQIFMARHDYEFYTMTNDDFVFQTPRWDEMLCVKRKICYGNDLLAKENMPTCPVIDGDIVRSVGWLQMPGLKYMYGDNCWKTLGNKLGCLKYFGTVIIEHKHWSNHKGEIDDVYKNANSEAVFREDGAAFELWKKNDLEHDAWKVRARLGM